MRLLMSYSMVFLIAALFINPVWARGVGLGGFHGGGGFRGGSWGHSGFHGGGWRHGGWGPVRHYGGIGFGVYGLGYSPGFYGGYYPYGGYYSYPSTTIIAPQTSPVYIQQTQPAVRQYPAGYWYYCDNPAGYYPTVSKCPNGWHQVEPRPTTSP
jgi:hypothetical protein